MQGNPEIIEVLNECLTAELTAVNQYFFHSKLCANWGYEKLAAHAREESIDEMRDAEAFIDRIIYLDGIPNMQRLFPIRAGETVREQFTIDLELETAAIERLNKGIALAQQVGDNGSRDLMQRILVGEEAHADWIESQLFAMNEIGDANYLSQQL